MSKTIQKVVGISLIVAGAVTGNLQLVIAGAQLTATAFAKAPGQKRQAQVASLSLGEGPREAVFGQVVTGGSLLDAFNHGGKYGTDWEVLVIGLADHLCDGLVGFYVGDKYVAFTGDGDVAGYKGQLRVRWHQGTLDQAADPTLTALGGWAASDRLAGVCYAVVEYMADASDAKNPVWPGGRPQFQWLLRGKRCYIPMLDDTVAGGAGPHRWNDPATRQWTDNLAVCRYNWVRGVYAGERVDQPGQLLVGRGLSEAEAPPARVAAHAALCAELVALKAGGSEPRYRCAAVIGSDEQFDAVEAKFAAACGGVITQPEGSIEVEPGHAKAIVAAITDDDLLIGESVTFNLFRSEADEEWCNTVVASYVEPLQKWQEHAAPVRRVYVDVLADGRPRERRLDLDYVTSGTQAQRCAEIARRLGRLSATGSLALGPRFCELEEGDWITYTSARRTRGATLTFRIEAYSGDAGWRTRLSLRQVAGAAYGWTVADEIAECASATQQAKPDDAAFVPVVARAAHLIAATDNGSPTTATVDAITIAASNVTLDDATRLALPAGEVTGLAAGTAYVVLWSLSAQSYSAVMLPALDALADADKVIVQYQATQAADGTYPPSPTPSPGSGGGGYGGGGRYNLPTAQP